MEAVLALQMCLFVLFFAENAARWVHPVDPYFARNARNPVTVYEKAPYTPGRPTFITLGSSPATTELSANRPFTRVLSERLAGVANFRIARLGGVDSAIILKLADDAWAGGTPVDGILLYAGFQDLNQSGIQKAFRHADVLGTSNAAMASVAWLARNSVLFNIVVERAKRQALSANSSGDEPAARAVFEGFTKNIRTLLDRARAHHTKVFVMTLVPDARRLSRVGNLYVDWVNDFYLSLPREYPEITVVDFATAFAARYPDGALSDGEPFEVATDGSGRPGDPYHLGRAGHELLADTVEPGIRVWAAKWESAR